MQKFWVKFAESLLIESAVVIGKISMPSGVGK